MSSRLCRLSWYAGLQIVKDIVNFLASRPDGGVKTPAGNMLRPRTLQLLGLSGAHPPSRIARCFACQHALFAHCRCVDTMTDRAARSTSDLAHRSITAAT